MNSNGMYKLISKIYGLLDVVYFRDNDKNPRKAVNDLIEDGKSVLDICTGTAVGAITVSKAKPHTKIVGVDLSKEMLSIARLNIKKHNIHNIKLGRMDATKTKFQDNTFDVIIMSLVLHEMPPKLASAMLKEAKRLLKEDGKIIVVEWEPPKNFIQKILFLPIPLLEPKSYHSFVKVDVEKYFAGFGLHIDRLMHCDYTKVIALTK